MSILSINNISQTMATIPLSWSATAAAPSSSSSHHLPRHRRGSTAKPPHFSGRPSKAHRLAVSCNQTNDGGENQKHDVENSPGRLDRRRNVLLGMGGLYSAANLVPAVVASPISSPDFTKCSRGTNLNTNKPLDVDCCPPVSTEIIDFKLPPVEKLRIRPAAQLAGEEYYAKFEKAIALMKALPADDPRSFMQQANVHCAYCNLTYDQTGADPEVKLQIHNCWHFFPWHRWYLYFYERILAKLIDDPTFALPFWNWDHPDGMPMPERYARTDSSLYNARRNQTHLPPVLLDLAYSPTAPTKPEKIIPNNLTVMYSEMIRNVKNLDDFYGAKYVTGTPPNPGPGTVERGSHTAAHVWTGEATATGEDMGNFYSTGRDTLFFAHHANVDRMWTIWRKLRGSKPKDYKEAEWLDSDYLFYDENAQLVRVNVKDTLENEKMGYVYEDRDLPWLKKRPAARVKRSKVAKSSKAPKAGESSIFPVKLDKVVKVLVPRPKKSRSKKDKDKEEELLVIEGIEVDNAKFVKFDVFVNDEDDKTDELDKAEYAGCFSQVPHKNSVTTKTKIRLGLTELLEDLDAEDDDKVLVSLVPKAGGEDITIGGIKIIYA
ncbi:polyphenol oxidase I, chloroplastic-like [Henckelia pumila]|uniref:polyphenol oxidase I, chloroplastic-like n=1 Tax=Henckelia pumila TaxID=405737 RepID=UPI003C6DD4C1